MPAILDPSLAATEARDHGTNHVRPGFWALTLGSVGVVYGDIGTSPLYALREALLHCQEGGVSREEVLGVTSLLLWALIFIVTGKYVLFLLRADNRGEGGTLSLMALAQSALGRATVPVFLLGVAGAALFYGDALITPAISVLSAVEGLKLVTPVFEPYVVPITVAILLGLFAVQRQGTGRVAAWFGPITAFWFLVMAGLGLVHLSDDLGVLAAFSPHHAFLFVSTHGGVGFVVLGSVFLAVTGTEALYADMGHFGRAPIQTAWIGLVFPALALNYLGQGAFVLKHPEALANPFFLLAPSWALLPLVLLATIATVIASQAVITGAFSVTQQAIQLGLLPRMEIQYTSDTHAGQIYLPDVNRLLLLGILLLVFMFQTSSALASAYGIAVTGSMAVDTALAFIVIWKAWRWPMALAIAVHHPVPDRRCDLPDGQPGQDPGRRLRAAADRGRDHARHVDLGARPARDLPQDPYRHAAARPDPALGEQAADPRPQHRHVPEQRPRHRAHGTAAQSQAQHGPAREQRGHERAHRPHPARRRFRAGADRAPVRRFQPGDPDLRLHGEPGHPQGAGARP